MLFGEIPDDCLRIIFHYIDELIEFRILESSCSFFHKGFTKDFINEYIQKKKIFIKTHFPDLIIRMVGGYNQILHYPIVHFSRPPYEHPIYLCTGPKQGARQPNITFEHMKYSIMIGRYLSGNNRYQSFISFVIKSTLTQPFSHHCPDEIDYSVLTIFQTHAYFGEFTDGSWSHSDHFLSKYNGNIFAAVKKGYFDILDTEFHDKLFRLICDESKHTENFNIIYNYSSHKSYEIENIPFYMNRLIKTPFIKNNIKNIA